MEGGILEKYQHLRVGVMTPKMSTIFWKMGMGIGRPNWCEVFVL